MCVLRVVKGRDGAEGIMKEFPRRNWSLASVKRLLQQIDTTRSGWWQSSRDSTGTSTGLKPVVKVRGVRGGSAPLLRLGPPLLESEPSTNWC